MSTIKIFNYVPQLNCFVVNPEYKKIADKLGITEWSEVVWIGRYFSLDNDNGEHWFDNWDARNELESKAKGLGIEYEQLLIINPDRFKNGHDGPRHTSDERRAFWTDVLKSLELSFDTIVNEAVKFNQERRGNEDEELIADLDERIKEIRGAHL